MRNWHTCPTGNFLSVKALVVALVGRRGPLKILCNIISHRCQDCCTPEAGDRDGADTAARQMEKWEEKEEARGYKVTIFTSDSIQRYIQGVAKHLVNFGSLHVTHF